MMKSTKFVSFLGSVSFLLCSCAAPTETIANTTEAADTSETAPQPPETTSQAVSTVPRSTAAAAQPVTISDTAVKIADVLADDYFVADKESGIYYSNISDEPSWKESAFTKGDSFGEIFYYTEELELNKIKAWSANVLPIGTRLYRTAEDKTVILAETDEALISYLKIVEG